jgi:sugar phosphate isomerase/epimerase
MRHLGRTTAVLCGLAAGFAMFPAVARCRAEEGGKPAAAWAPKLYAFCMDIADAKKRTLPEQAQMLRELGFDGAGYPVWLDASADANLQTLDQSQLKLAIAWTTVNVNPDAKPFDPKLLDTLRKLKGRNTTVCVLLQGLPPADPRGEQPAIRALRQLGDAAAASDLRVSIYHHTGDWTQSLLDAAQLVKKVDHPRVGLNFNLCHWLMIDGDKDYRPVLKENASKIFVVTINGAKLGTKTWTNGLIQGLDQGDFDNRQLLALVREIGYRGPIGLMCYGMPGDARDHLEASMKVWRSWQSEWKKP